MKKILITLTIMAAAGFASAEMNAKQKTVFKQMDTNKDGIVTEAEYLAKGAQWDKKSGKDQTKKHKDTVKKLDKNKDGKLTPEEFGNR